MTKWPLTTAGITKASLAALFLFGIALVTLAGTHEAWGQDTPPASGAASDAAPAPLESGASAAAPGPSGPLVVVSRGGVYAKSQDEAILRPFARATGIEISARTYTGELDRLRAQAAAGNVLWDVVDVDPAEARAGCNEGLFEKLSFVLPAAPDGTAATDDFLPGTIQPCAVGSLAWSMLIVHSPDGTAGDPPDRLADFFDLAAFPGGRGLRRTPMANLEWALMADGVPPQAVYDLLRSQAGVERAFAKLDTIREAIVWWEQADEPGRLLASGAVTMSSSYNAPMFIDVAVRQRPFRLIWDGQIWDIDLWAIPTAAPHREAALEFLRFATSSEPLAHQTRWIPFGPVRRSALALVADHVHAAIDIAPLLPTAPENLMTALRNDAVFWQEEGPALVDRFNAWLVR